MRVIASFAAAASMAATALLLPASPAAAAPGDARVYVALPTSSASPLALPIVCTVHAGAQEDADLTTSRYYGTVSCTAPVGINAQAELGTGYPPVWGQGTGNAISCVCAGGTSTGTHPDAVLMHVLFNGSLTAPEGYTWDTGGDTVGFNMWVVTAGVDAG